jgi:hypothetical protein
MDEATASHPFIVTLNLFQGPSGGVSRSRQMNARRAVGLHSKPMASGSVEGWALKRVQGDEFVWGLA